MNQSGKTRSAAVREGDTVSVILQPWLSWAIARRDEIQIEMDAVPSWERDETPFLRLCSRIKHLNTAINDLSWVRHLYQVMVIHDDGMAVIQQLTKNGDRPLTSGIKKQLPINSIGVMPRVSTKPKPLPPIPADHQPVPIAIKLSELGMIRFDVEANIQRRAIAAKTLMNRLRGAE